MAKDKTKHPAHMHVPTRIGFVVLGIAVMVYALFLTSATITNNDTATLQSHASGPTPRPIKPTPRPTPRPVCHNQQVCAYFNIHLGICTSYRTVKVCN